MRPRDQAHDGPRRRPAAAEALPRRHGPRGPYFRVADSSRTFTTAQGCPQGVDRRKGDLIRRSTPFGGRPEATEQQHQADEHRGVGVVERRDDVARQDGEHAQHDEHQHEDGHPLRALVELLGSGRRVPSAGRHRRIVVVGLLGHRGGVGQAGLGALGGDPARRGALRRCHWGKSRRNPFDNRRSHTAGCAGAARAGDRCRSVLAHSGL